MPIPTQHANIESEGAFRVTRPLEQLNDRCVVSPPLAGVFTDVWGATRADDGGTQLEVNPVAVVVPVLVSAREAMP